MNSEGFIKQEGLILFNLQDNFDTSEAMDIGKLAQNIIKKKVHFEVQELELPFNPSDMEQKATVPVLIIDSGERIKDINNISDYIKNRLYSTIRGIWRVNLFSKTDDYVCLGYEHNKPVANDFIDTKEKTFTKGSLFNVYNVGDTFFITPNHGYLWFEEGDLKKGNYLKKTLMKKNSFIDELRRRKNVIREYQYSTLRSLANYSVDDLVVLSVQRFLCSGIEVGFMDKKYRSVLEEKSIVPFNISKENKFAFKTEEEIEKEFQKKEADELKRTSNNASA